MQKRDILTGHLNIWRVTWKYLVSVRSPDSMSINFATKLQMSCYQMQTCPMHLNYSHHLQASPCSWITGRQSLFSKLLLTLRPICNALKLKGCNILHSWKVLECFAWFAQFVHSYEPFLPYFWECQLYISRLQHSWEMGGGAGKGKILLGMRMSQAVQRRDGS